MVVVAEVLSVQVSELVMVVVVIVVFVAVTGVVVVLVACADGHEVGAQGEVLARMSE